MFTNFVILLNPKNQKYRYTGCWIRRGSISFRSATIIVSSIWAVRCVELTRNDTVQPVPLAKVLHLRQVEFGDGIKNFVKNPLSVVNE